MKKNHLIIALLFVVSLLAQQARAQGFQHLTTKDGLAGNSVTVVEVDASGFVWIGSTGGLNRHEGGRIVTYVHAPDDSLTIPHSWIQTLHVSTNGELWVGTQNGLAKYDPRADVFKRVNFSVTENIAVLDITEEASGSLLISTWIHGLYRVHPTTFEATQVLDQATASLRGPRPDLRTIRHLHVSSTGKTWLSSYSGLWLFNSDENSIFLPKWPKVSLDFVQDAVIMDILELEGLLWLATFSGVVSIDVLSGAITKHPIPRDDPEWNLIRDLQFDSQGQLWFGTEAGLARLDPKTGFIDVFEHDERTPLSISPGIVLSVAEDLSGNIWATSDEAGISQLDIYRKSITSFTRKTHPDSNIPEGNFSAATTTTNGDLWFGTEAGLAKWDGPNQTLDLRNPVNSPNIKVTSLLANNDGSLWLGTYESGVCKYHIVSKTCDPVFQDIVLVNDIAKTPDGTLWLAGLNKLVQLNPETGASVTFVHDADDERSLIGGYVADIEIDKTGRVWIGTDYGVNRYDPVSGGLNRIVELETSMQIHLLPDGRLWIVGDQVHLFDPDTQQLGPRVEFDGHRTAGGAISAVMEKDGHLWANLNEEMVRINPEGQIVDRFTGLSADNSFDLPISANLRLPDGKLVIGFLNGFYLFDPKELSHNPFPPVPQFTSVILDGESSSLYDINSVEVSYVDRIVSFQFSTPHYTYPDEIQYEVWMSGFETGWRKVSQPSVTFTNLRPATYQLRVRAKAPNGLLSESRSALTVIVIPPWWNTTWFFLMMASTGVITLLGLYRWRVQNLLANSLRLDRLIGERTSELAVQAKELQEANDLKSRFFSNVSHELRTPLTLIGGYLDDMSQEQETGLSPEQGKRISRAKALTQKLDSLVIQLLDLSRAEGNRLKIRPSRGNLAKFAHEITGHFSVEANKKFIDLTFESQRDHVWVNMDPIKMDQIVANLIGNALKFTPKNGSVWVSVRIQNDSVVLSVADTGPGIAELDLPHVFDRFYQADNDLTREHSGLGIGMALTKDLVELHEGTIKVSSVQGEGAVFTVLFPLLAPEPDPSTESKNEQALYLDIDVESTEKKRTLLIVEDNSELRHHLSTILIDLFEIREAENGTEAWKMIRQSAPDIILSDVMMPGMSGLDLLQEIRQHSKVHNVPVVLLTARAGIEAEIEGYEARADAYIQKPFNRRVLRARLLNLAQREVDWNSTLPAASKSLTKAQSRILLAVNEYIVAHLDSPDLKVAELAQITFTSERTFQRHMKSITGGTAAAFIREVRLKHARQLLEEGSVRSVTQAANETGFGNVSYFSKLFEEAFGLNPKSYLK